MKNDMSRFLWNFLAEATSSGSAKLASGECCFGALACFSSPVGHTPVMHHCDEASRELCLHPIVHCTLFPSLPSALPLLLSLEPSLCESDTQGNRPHPFILTLGGQGKVYL